MNLIYNCRPVGAPNHPGDRQRIEAFTPEGFSRIKIDGAVHNLLAGDDWVEFSPADTSDVRIVFDDIDVLARAEVLPNPAVVRPDDGEDPVGDVIRKGARRVVMEPGIYPFPKPCDVGDEWVSIESRVPFAAWFKPNDPHDQREAFRVGIDKLKLHKVSFEMGWAGQFYPEAGHTWWFNRCQFYDSYGNDPTNSPVQVVNKHTFRDAEGQQIISTHNRYINTQNGPTRAYISEGDLCVRVWQDVWQNSQLVANGQAHNIRGWEIEKAHPDLFQYHNGDYVNVLVKNLRGRGEGYQTCYLNDRNATMANSAFVDIIADVRNTGSRKAQICCPCDNVLFRNVGGEGQDLLIRKDQGFTGTLRIERSRFGEIRVTPRGDPLPDGVEIVVEGVK